MGARPSRLGSSRKEKPGTTPTNIHIPQLNMANRALQEPRAKHEQVAAVKETSATASNSPNILKPDLPSQVEETLAACPRFRIVLVGGTGVGKSSLVTAVFNISLSTESSVRGTKLGSSQSTSTGLQPAIDIADDRAGQANISKEYCSDENPRFILHDSMGFEPGSTKKSEIVRSFLQDRAENNPKLPDRVHAIWLCIETPRTGSRLLQTGDEDLLKLAEQLKIPVILVFTKYDLLVMEYFRPKDGQTPLSPVTKVEAATRAKKAFDEVTKELKVPFISVSTGKVSRGLSELTQLTQDNLRDVAAPLWILWATAQQVNARQKVELSISEGFKKYWRNLSESMVFRGHTLVHCIERIHDDVLKVWNFNDPLQLLSKAPFLEGMLDLVEPLRDGQVIKTPQANDMADLASNVATAAGAVGSSVVLPALATIAAVKGFQFLFSTYQNGVSTATYLTAYIVDLTLVLYDISLMVTADPPRSISRELVEIALGLYKSRSPQIHDQVKDVVLSPNLDERVAKVIRDSLRK